MRSGLNAWMIAAALTAASEAVAQPYAVASLLGHELSVAFNHETVHSRIASNVTAIPVADAVFDTAAGSAVKLAVRKTDPQRKFIELAVSDPAMIAAAKIAPQLDSAEFRAIVDPLVALVRPAGAERLILVLPHRHELIIPSRDRGTEAIGKGAGLGLYIDRSTRLTRADTREVGRGFLGLFANFRIVIVDASSGRVLADDWVATGTSFSAAHAPDADPLNAIPTERKIANLKALVQNGIADRLPALLDKAGR